MPDTMRARGISEEQIVRDVLLKAQPMRRCVRAAEFVAWALRFAGPAAASIMRTARFIDGGWPAR